MEKDPIVITGIARTPQGNLLGVLKDVAATELGSQAILAAIQRSNLPLDQVQEVIMGCVLPAGLGQAPARQAALLAGLPTSTPCTTINKICGSGMKAIMQAYDSIIAGSNSIFVVGGMESMTNAPYLLLKARQGYRLGHNELFDHMMLDGLEDAYQKKKPMGFFAEQCAEQFGFTRQDQDNYAITSLKRAQQAADNGSFDGEIIPVKIKTKQGELIISKDEHPTSVKIEKIPDLPPVFKENGTVTAANSSSIADGAAALVLMKLSEAQKLNIKPIAKIISHASFAKEPQDFATAPIDGIKKLLSKINWSIDQVDLFEINEAFAVVALAAMKALKIPHDKLNIHGSGCALGHPIGATGARIVVTLLSALKQYKLKRGIASLCIGGGEATALAVEML